MESGNNNPGRGNLGGQQSGSTKISELPMPIPPALADKEINPSLHRRIWGVDGAEEAAGFAVTTFGISPSPPLSAFSASAAAAAAAAAGPALALSLSPIRPRATAAATEDAVSVAASLARLPTESTAATVTVTVTDPQRPSSPSPSHSAQPVNAAAITTATAAAAAGGGSPSRSLQSEPGRSRDGAPVSGRKRKPVSSAAEDELLQTINSDSMDHSNDVMNKRMNNKMESPTPQDTKKIKGIDHYFKKAGGLSGKEKEKSGGNALSAVSLSSASSFAHDFSGPIDLSCDSPHSPFVVIPASSSKARSSSSASKDQATIAELKKQVETMKFAKEQAELKVQRMELELKEALEKAKKAEERNTKLMKALEDVHRKLAFQEFKRTRDKLAADNVRLGKVATHRTSSVHYTEVWEDGYVWKELNKRNAELIGRREELEARRRKFQNLKRAASKKSVSSVSTTSEDGSGSNGSGGADSSDWDLEFDVITEAESVRLHGEQLKNDEKALAEEKRILETEKAIHIKELKRTQCEERSRFYRDLPCFNGRYLLQSLLGRGGFSEVWKAIDLLEIRDVAVKIHQLNASWSEERKASYIRHVTREYNIHREMKHARVVQLYDVFEIDVNSFATVLEYCRGIDLDEKLKRMKVLPEKDAKTILMQILCGLRYLHRPLNYTGIYSDPAADQQGESSQSKKRTIIHYDLKPANILFDEMGDVKITDFGLAKILDDDHGGTSMELTSQGAGTYWYLPPECFEKGPTPRISSKVDVWSAGIVFFQMLFGSRPFGEGKTQENVWSENIIYNASSVQFPTDPKIKISEEAKDVIRLCLTKDQRLRPDVDSLWQHPYFKK